MKKLIIANWKAHMSIRGATEWVKTLRPVLEESYAQIVLLPDYLSIPVVASLLSLGSVKVGSQDISVQGPGNFTGEVVGESLKGLAKYALIGHSERRAHYGEDTELIVNKVIRAQECDITPVVCFGNVEELLDYKNRKGILDVIFAYEDPTHIGTGEAVDSATAKEVLSAFREKVGEGKSVVYGGSVNTENADSFIKIGFDGLLVGSSSLIEFEFAKIVRSVSQLIKDES